ncbi:MAG: hypothetical protein RLZZ306_810 [Bacteroidota bacterium]|jgi:hypothetical protein
MTKKFLLIFALFSIFSHISKAQDIITYKNGKTQKVIVLTTNQETVTCQDFETKEQFSISKTFIDNVKYQEGKSEPFGVALTKISTVDTNALKNKTNQKILFSDPYLSNSLRYKGFHEAGYVASLSEEFVSRVSIISSNGMVIDNSVYLGVMVGIGLPTSNIGAGGGYLVGLDPKILVSNRNESPNFWMGCKLGVEINDETNVFFHPHFIIEPVSSKSKTNFFISGGYLLQQGEVLIWSGYSGRFEKTFSSNLTISVGLSF